MMDMATDQFAPGDRDFVDLSGDGEVPRLPRKEREYERHRLEVLHVADTLLQRRLYHEISVQETATEAEFSVGYLYKLFSSKEDIYVSLIQGKFEDVRLCIDTALSSDGSQEERLTRLVQAVFDWFKGNPAFSSTYVGELVVLAGMNTDLARLIAQHETYVVERLNRFFQECIDEGLLLRVEPDEITRTLRALLRGFVGENILNTSHGQKPKDWTDYGPMIVRIIVQAFGGNKQTSQKDSMSGSVEPAGNISHRGPPGFDICDADFRAGHVFDL